jgi:hypothetical protein
LRLHREWYQRSAMGDLLGEDLEVISKYKLYRCLDQLLLHKKELFTHLTQRWATLFQARFDILLYDLTSIYLESDPPGVGKRQFGYWISAFVGMTRTFRRNRSDRKYSLSKLR